MKEITSPDGRLVITEEAVSTIASAAAAGTPGVAGLAGRGLTGMLGRDLATRLGDAAAGAGTPPWAAGHGVDVALDGERLDVGLGIIVDYGVRIHDVAQDVQRRVREAVTAMTGLEIRHVAIRVQGVRPPERRPGSAPRGEGGRRSEARPERPARGRGASGSSAPRRG